MRRTFKGEMRIDRWDVRKRDAVDKDEGFAEVRLCVARRMCQRQEHLLAAQLLLTNVLVGTAVASWKTALIAQAIKNALGGCAAAS